MAWHIFAPLFLWIPLSVVPQEDAKDPDALLRQALSAQQSENYQEAVEAYEAVIQEDPRNVRALHQLARLYATASDPEFFNGKLAVEWALLALDDSPDDPEIIDTLAMGYFAQNKFDKAIHETLRCMELNPYDPHYARQLKKFAITWKARLDMTYPGREVAEKNQASFFLGLAHYRLGELQEAKGELERASRTGGEERSACLYLARVKTALGEPTQAIEALEGLGDALENDAGLLLELCKAYRAVGDIEAAAAHGEKAYGLVPEVPGLRLELGRVYLQMNKGVKAVVLLLEALENLDRSALFSEEAEAEIQYALGMALAGEGEVEDGLARLFDAVTLKPDLPDAARDLVSLYVKKTGSSDGIRTYLAGLRPFEMIYFDEKSSEAGVSGTGPPAFGDVDGDGDPDLLLSGCRLFQNDGRGRFKEVTDDVGLPGEGGHGGVLGDVDNDGDLDLFMTVNKAGWKDRLFRNEGKRGFKDVSEEEGSPSDLNPTRAAAFLDVNGDGFLDLYLANGDPEEGSPVQAYPDSLFLGQGNGRFADATEASGIGGLNPLCSMGVTSADFDNDGDMDLFVAQGNLGPNRFLRNVGRGRFQDAADLLGAAGNGFDGRFGDTMAAVFGDVDGDGNLDLFVANQAEPKDLLFADRSMMLHNSGRPDYRFKDQTSARGIRYGRGHLQPLFTDFNQDGRLDLFLASGGADQACKLYLGHEGIFSDVTWIAGLKAAGALGCAAADVDLDGDVDLFVAGSGRPFLFINQGTKQHWIAFRLKGKACNGTGIGARITVDYNGMSQFQEVSGGAGACCQDDMAVYFGLGSYSGKVNVTVHWPHGRSDFAPSLRPDRIHTLTEGG